MNKKTVISIILVMVTVITVALISSSSPASGNYYTVAQLRASEKLYDSATLIHTHELSDKHVDFIIDKDDNYCVVEINKKTTLFEQQSEAVLYHCFAQSLKYSDAQKNHSLPQGNCRTVFQYFG